MSERIDPAQAIRLLDAGKAQAVDVREPDEYEMGHIPGAVLLPLGQVTAKAAQLLPDPQAVWLVYCRTGRRSAEAVRLLEQMGYEHLYDLGASCAGPMRSRGISTACFEQRPLRHTL